MPQSTGLQHESEHRRLSEIYLSEGRGGLPTTTANLYTSQRLWDQSRNVEFYWNGALWLSTQLHRAPLVPSDFANPRAAAGAGSTFSMSLILPGNYLVYIERLTLYVRANANHTGANYYTVALSSGAGFNTQTVVAGDNYIERGIGATFDPTPGGKAWTTTLTQVGSPSTGQYLAALQYRLIG